MPDLKEQRVGDVFAVNCSGFDEKSLLFLSSKICVFLLRSGYTHLSHYGPFFFFQKWTNPGLFLSIFGLFKQTIQFLKQINVKKMSIQYTATGFQPTRQGTIVTDLIMP